jgi:hypothetical protein
MNLLSQSGAGVWFAGRVVPGLSVRIPKEHATGFVVARKPRMPAAAVFGRNFIEAEDTDENHAHDRSSKEKGLPTGLKCNPLHVYLPAQQTADVK